MTHLVRGASNARTLVSLVSKPMLLINVLYCFPEEQASGSCTLWLSLLWMFLVCPHFVRPQNNSLCHNLGVP